MGMPPGPPITTEQFDACLPATPESVPRLRHAVTRYARGVGASERVGRKVALAVSEACTNAVVHAYRHGARGRVAVHAERRGRALCVEVLDEGAGMLPRTDSPGLGLGTPMMAILSDGLEIAHNPDGHGTVVRLEFGL